MTTNTRRIHEQARRDRAAAIGTLIGRALGALSQWVSKAWRSSSASGTNSSALS